MEVKIVQKQDIQQKQVYVLLVIAQRKMKDIAQNSVMDIKKEEKYLLIIQKKQYQIGKGCNCLKWYEEQLNRKFIRTQILKKRIKINLEVKEFIKYILERRKKRIYDKENSMKQRNRYRLQSWQRLVFMSLQKFIIEKRIQRRGPKCGLKNGQSLLKRINKKKISKRQILNMREQMKKKEEMDEIEEEFIIPQGILEQIEMQQFEIYQQQRTANH